MKELFEETNNISTSMEFDRLVESSPEKNKWQRLTFSFDNLSISHLEFEDDFRQEPLSSWAPAFAQVVETSVTANSPSQDYFHPDDQIPSRYVTPWFKLFSNKVSVT